MSDFFATNVGNITGTDGVDRLTVTYDFGIGAESLTNLTGTLATGYSGTFDGAGANAVVFSAIENFSFFDISGGNDNIITGNGDDGLFGGAGNDTLNSAGGIDTVNGGTGNDVWGADKSFATVAINIDLNQASSTYLSTGSVSHIEGLNLKTGSGKDHITGSSTAVMNDNIDTGAGNDVITLWGGGADTVNGGAGNDRLSVIYNTFINNNVQLTNLTADTVNGGYQGTFEGALANDVVFHGIENFTFIDRSGGNDVINTGNGRDKLLGGGGKDKLNGGGGGDTIQGGVGADTLTGSSGNDHMLGAKGNDAIGGGSGADTISGGGGSDTITGGGGNDRLTGNKGFDTFVFANGFGHDTVFGFAAANQEKIDLIAVTAVTGFRDLVNHHLTTDTATGFAEIVVGTNTILLIGVHQSDIGVGDIYSAGDFIFA